jgi:hypothetical protein
MASYDTFGKFYDAIMGDRAGRRWGVALTPPPVSTSSDLVSGELKGSDISFDYI